MYGKVKKKLDSKVLLVLYGKGIANTEQIIPMCGCPSVDG
jgi:hypothetical protein